MRRISKLGVLSVHYFGYWVLLIWAFLLPQWVSIVVSFPFVLFADLCSMFRGGHSVGDVG